MLRLLASSLARHAQPQQLTASIPAAACSQPLQRVLQQGLHTSSSLSAGSGYSVFVKEQYPSHKDIGDFSAVSKTLGAKYRQLPQEQKEAYKARWEQEKNTPPPPPKPKAKYSGWTLYLKERLGQSKAQLGPDEALDMPAMMKQVGEEWKALPEHAKEDYKAKAQAMGFKEQ